MDLFSADGTAAIGEGLAFLGVRRLVLAIHDGSFPSLAGEDIGRGSPYGVGARALLTLARSTGFGGVQLGPQGYTSLANPSPYDGALFTRNPLSLVPSTLREDPAWERLCDGLPTEPAGDPGARGTGTAPSEDRQRYDHAWRTTRARLETLHTRFRVGRAAGEHTDLANRFAVFRRQRASVLERDGDFEALTVAHGSDDWRRWPQVDQLLHAAAPTSSADARGARKLQLRADGAVDIERHSFGQFMLHEQHAALRRATGPGTANEMTLYGDFQIGMSHRDVWSRRDLFLTDYLMGAPPSRTNPGGQPWGYPVLDPLQYASPAVDGDESIGGAQRLLLDRAQLMLDDFDGLRIDHPHGLVCPWVYATRDPDAAAAVGRGARLFCSPNLADHPALARFAIPEAGQISQDPSIARYADDWVRDLRGDQVARYGLLFDAIMARVSAMGKQPADVVCEVLSTWPRPLREVMQRHGLGRFCVTQKADLTRDDDVYRSENVSPRDWIMVGNHDTPPIWLLADAWHGTAMGTERASHLSRLLIRDPALRSRLARWLAADGRNLAQAMFAELFASRAAHVSIFFADLFGMKALYNRPGVIHPDNWMLRLPPDFGADYQARLRDGGACNIPLALTLAIASRPPPTDAPAALARARIAVTLLSIARRLTPAIDDDIASLVEASLK